MGKKLREIITNIQLIIAALSYDIAWEHFTQEAKLKIKGAKSVTVTVHGELGNVVWSKQRDLVNGEK